MPPLRGDNYPLFRVRQEVSSIVPSNYVIIQIQSLRNMKAFDATIISDSLSLFQLINVQSDQLAVTSSALAANPISIYERVYTFPMRELNSLFNM